MIVQFAMLEESIDALARDPSRCFIWSTIVEKWLGYGVLRISEDEQIRKLIKIVEDMHSVAMKKKCIEGMSYLRKKGLLDIKEIDLSKIAKEVSVISVENPHNISDVELCKYDDLSFSKAFCDIERNQQYEARVNDCVANIWKDLILSPFKIANKVIVVDRYYAGESGYDQAALDKINRFNRHMNECAIDIMQIYCLGKRRYYDKKEAEKYYKEQISIKPAKEVEVIFVDDYFFKKIAHDRYVRSKTDVIEIGRGIALFEDNKIIHNTSLMHHRKVDRKIEIEAKLYQNKIATLRY